MVDSRKEMENDKYFVSWRTGKIERETMVRLIDSYWGYNRFLICNRILLLAYGETKINAYVIVRGSRT